MLKSVDAQFATAFLSLKSQSAPTGEVGSVFLPQKHFVPSARFGKDDSSRDKNCRGGGGRQQKDSWHGGKRYEAWRPSACPSGARGAYCLSYTLMSS